MTRRPGIFGALNGASLWFVALVAAVCLLAAAAFVPLERYLMSRMAAEGDARLRIAVEGLSGTITSFQPLPKLIAERPILVETLRDPTNAGLVPFVNEQLRLTAFSLGVSDVFLMDLAGNTIAASSYRKDTSFVGKNFGYRPYFQQAVEGGLGQFFAKGAITGERGYFLAAPVLDGTRIIGVLAVKLPVDTFEQSWRGGVGEVLATDLSGVIFMSSREDWQFRTLAPLSPGDLDRIARTRQYPVADLAPLGAESTQVRPGLTLFRVGEETMLRSDATIPEAGLRVLVLTPAGPARTQALIILAAAGLVALSAGLAFQIIHDRRARARERQVEAEEATLELERRVAQRTADLAVANTRLVEEIDERRATEARLRDTQTELIQAGKLAALGQMSAALSHEINQPLAAVKSYADNAATFLDRGRADDARDNVSRISVMADRMASISGHLRNFARRPQEGVEPVEVQGILADALELMAGRVRGAGARAVTTLPDHPVWASGGRLRLQQVIVNLISNALDAMEDVPKAARELHIVLTDGDRVDVTVTDRGPGLTEEVEARLFDPFFTTKRPGQGLGLGLSISFNIVEDFGGRLSAKNTDGGASFTVSLLPAAPAAQTEAAE
ncbi:MAG: ATP-binding protein [Pseudomonadota bacterium]